MPPILKNLAMRAANEWERLLLLAAVILLLIVAAASGRRLMRSMDPPQGRGAGSGSVYGLFNHGAFAFVDGAPEQPDIGHQHAFRVVPPPGWKPPRPPRPPDDGQEQAVATQPDDEPPNDDDGAPAPPDDGDDQQAAPDGQGETVVDVPPTPPAEDDTEVVQAPPGNGGGEEPPQPKAKHFLTYKGYMRSSSGAPLAYLTHEVRPPGERRPRKESSFLGEGESIRKLQVEKFDRDSVTLKTEDGQVLVIPKGDTEEFP